MKNLNKLKDEEFFIIEALSILKTYCYCQSQEITFKHQFQMIYLQEILHGQFQLF